MALHAWVVEEEHAKPLYTCLVALILLELHVEDIFPGDELFRLGWSDMSRRALSDIAPVG